MKILQFYEMYALEQFCYFLFWVHNSNPLGLTAKPLWIHFFLGSIGSNTFFKKVFEVIFYVFIMNSVVFEMVFILKARQLLDFF